MTRSDIRTGTKGDQIGAKVGLKGIKGVRKGVRGVQMGSKLGLGVKMGLLKHILASQLYGLEFTISVILDVEYHINWVRVDNTGPNNHKQTNTVLRNPHLGRHHAP